MKVTEENHSARIAHAPEIPMRITSGLNINYTNTA